MHILVAPDKFKGTLRATEAVAVICAVLEARGHTCGAQPLADGGEGTLDALGGPNRTTTVSGPLGDPVVAQWRMGSGRRAVIEMAQASGLQLVGGAAGNDPVAAHTAGTGELIDAAVERGARSIVVAVGGSASTDGGWGAVQAMQPLGRFRGVELVVATDVRTRFLDAATVFGPQKGASPAQVELLRRRLVRLAQVYEETHGIDVTALRGGGAAGGLAGGLAAVGATIVDGFDVVADACGLDEQIAEADLVITGEGRLDESSFAGKVVGGVASLADDLGTSAAAVVGVCDPEVAARIPVRSCAQAAGLERAMADPAGSLALATGLLCDDLGI